MASETHTAAVESEQAPVSLLQFPEDVLLHLVALLPCNERKEFRLCCKQLCTLINPSLRTIHIDRDLQQRLVTNKPNKPTSSPLFFLSHLPKLTNAILHSSLNPSHIPALLSCLPSLTFLSALSLPLTQDTIPHLSTPPSLRSLRLSTHIPAVRFCSSSSHDPIPLSTFTSLTHLTLRCTNDAPQSPDPLPGLQSLAACPLLQSADLRFSTSSRYILDGQISAAHWLDPLSSLPLLSTLTLLLDHTCDSTWEPPLDFALPPLPHLTRLTTQADYGCLLSTLHNAPALLSLTLLPPHTHTQLSWPTPNPPTPILPHLTHLTIPGPLLTLPTTPEFPSLRTLTLRPALTPSTPTPTLLQSLHDLLPQLITLTLSPAPGPTTPLPEFQSLLTSIRSRKSKLSKLSILRQVAPARDAALSPYPPSDPLDDPDTNVQHLRLMWFATCAEMDGPDVLYHERLDNPVCAAD